MIYLYKLTQIHGRKKIFFLIAGFQFPFGLIEIRLQFD